MRVNSSPVGAMHGIDKQVKRLSRVGGQDDDGIDAQTPREGDKSCEGRDRLASFDLR